MKPSEFKPDVELFTKLGEMERSHKDNKAIHREDNEEMADEKLTKYSELASGVWDIKLIKGNLPKSARDAFWDALTKHAGLSKAKADRYLKNTVGISRMRKEIGVPTQDSSSTGIKVALLAKDLTSENRITKFVAGEDELTPEMEVVKQFVGSWTRAKDEDGVSRPNVYKVGKHADRLDELREALDEAERVQKAARGLMEQAEDDRAAFADVMAILDAQVPEQEDAA